MCKFVYIIRSDRRVWGPATALISQIEHIHSDSHSSNCGDCRVCSARSILPREDCTAVAPIEPFPQSSQGMDSPKRSSPQQEEDTLSSLFQNSSISNSSSAPGNSIQSSTPPSDDGEKLPLTIGIEMECLFVYNRKAALADFGPAPERGDVDRYLNETPGDPSPIRMVIQALSRANVDVYLAGR